MLDDLYLRIGGAAAVGAAVNKLHERLVEDPLTKGYFSQADMRNSKKILRAFLAVALGGPDAYYGRNLMAAHAHLKISDPEFNAMAQHLQEVMVELFVGPHDVAAVMASVESQRSSVVTNGLVASR